MSWEEHLSKRVVDLERQVWDLEDIIEELQDKISHLHLQLAEKQNEVYAARTGGGNH